MDKIQNLYYGGQYRPATSLGSGGTKSVYQVIDDNGSPIALSRLHFNSVLKEQKNTETLRNAGAKVIDFYEPWKNEKGEILGAAMKPFREHGFDIIDVKNDPPQIKNLILPYLEGFDSPEKVENLPIFEKLAREKAQLRDNRLHVQGGDAHNLAIDKDGVHHFYFDLVDSLHTDKTASPKKMAEQIITVLASSCNQGLTDAQKAIGKKVTDIEYDEELSEEAIARLAKMISKFSKVV